MGIKCRRFHYANNSYFNAHNLITNSKHFSIKNMRKMKSQVLNEVSTKNKSRIKVILITKKDYQTHICSGFSHVYIFASIVKLFWCVFLCLLS